MKSPVVEEVKFDDVSIFPSLIDRWTSEARLKIQKITDFYFEKNATRSGGIRKKNLIPQLRHVYSQMIEKELLTFKKNSNETASFHCQSIY